MVSTVGWVVVGCVELFSAEFEVSEDCTDSKDVVLVRNKLVV